MGNPTSIGIKGGADLNARIQELDQEQALQKVQELSVQLKGKSGVLQLVNADNASKDVRFERKSWWQFGSRSEANKTRTAEALKELVGRANLDTAKLEQYLAQRGGRAGTRTLSEVLSEMVATKQAQVVPPHSQLNNDPVQQDQAGSSQLAAPQEGSGLSILSPQLEANPQQEIQGQAHALIENESLKQPEVGAGQVSVSVDVNEAQNKQDQADSSQLAAPQEGSGLSILSPQLEANSQQEIQGQAHALIENESLKQSEVGAGQISVSVDVNKAQNKQDQAQSPVLLPLSKSARETLKRALSKGNFPEAVHVMTGFSTVRKPFLMEPRNIARFLVNDHFRGKASTTGLVNFASSLWKVPYHFVGVAEDGRKNMYQRNQDGIVAEFLLAAYNIPSPAGKDVDLAHLKPLANALRLWEATWLVRDRHSSRSGEVANKIIEQLCPESVDSVTHTKLKEVLAPPNDLSDIHLDLEDYRTSDKEDEYVRIAQEKLARSGSDLLTAYFSLDDASSTRQAREKLLARIQNETPAKLTASYLNGGGIKRAENSMIRNPTGNLRNASLLNCLILGKTKDADFSNANLTGSNITLTVLFREADRPDQPVAADFTNASLDDADITIEYDHLEASYRRSSDELKREACLRVLNAQTEGKPSGPLLTINSVGARYDGIKRKLMLAALQVAKRAGAVDGLSNDWVDALKGNRVYLADREIKQLAQPLLDRVDG